MIEQDSKQPGRAFAKWQQADNSAPLKKGDEVKIGAWQIPIVDEDYREVRCIIAKVVICVNNLKVFSDESIWPTKIGKTHLLLQVWILSKMAAHSNPQFHPVLEKFCEMFPEFEEPESGISIVLW
jgi:hypothetical protein